jgi:hypothetical protein
VATADEAESESVLGKGADDEEIDLDDGLEEEVEEDAEGDRVEAASAANRGRREPCFAASPAADDARGANSTGKQQRGIILSICRWPSCRRSATRSGVEAARSWCE